MAIYEITDRQEPIDFECSRDATRRTLQNAKNLLMCRMGEVPYDRQRGLNPKLYDMPLTQARTLLMPELDRVMLWEPNVEVINAMIGVEDGETIIRCAIEIAE